MRVRPRGKAVKGQRREASARAGRTKVTILTVVAEAVPPERLRLQEAPGGLFRLYREDLRLSPTGMGTEVKAEFEYELSLEYVGEALNIAMLDKGIVNSLGNFLKNLKEVAELRPIEAAAAQERRT